MLFGHDTGVVGEGRVHVFECTCHTSPAQPENPTKHWSITPTIVEIVVEAPAAARNFEPGQFYRLQNYEACSKRVDHTLLTMEGLALTGAWVDKEKGLLSLIALEMGGSSDLCAMLEPGEPVIVMGPTGTPTEIEPGETVVLAGGGLGNAVLFSIGQAFRKAGSKVLYFAGYKKMIDRYKVEEIEAAADVVVWCCDEAPGFEPGRPQDRSVVTNIVEAMRLYASGELGDQPIPYGAADRIVAIGSDGMMNAVRLARHTALKPFLKPEHVAFGSINSPMQCMMKEICAQCLQPLEKFFDSHGVGMLAPSRPASMKKAPTAVCRQGFGVRLEAGAYLARLCSLDMAVWLTSVASALKASP